MLIWKEQTFNTVPFIILLNQTGFVRSKDIFLFDDEKLLKQRFFSQKERIDHSKDMFKRLQYFLILSDLFAGLHAWFVKEVSVVTLKTAKLCKFYIWRTLLKKSHTRAARPTDGRNRVEGERERGSVVEIFLKRFCAWPILGLGVFYLCRAKESGSLIV